MQTTPVTIAERFSAIGGAAVLAFVIFLVATLLHKAISKNDDRKRQQGRPIRWWVTGLYLAGAIAGAMLADGRKYYMQEIVGGLGGFGILAGLLIGNVHGGINLLLNPISPNSSDTAISVPVSETPVQDDVNPYSPPTQQ